ncbi:unnamed protein product [Rotaria socialis]
MDFEYFRMVLNDFTMKELLIINWLDNNLDKSINDRQSKILYLLLEFCDDDMKEWTILKVEQALMAINELGFLNRNEEKKLDICLRTYLRSEKCSNIIVTPFVKICCGSRLNMSTGRNITVFNNNNSYIATIMTGYCEECKRKYSHNYFIEDKQKFVTHESILDSQIVYLGGEYAYEKTLIKLLSNSILYLHSGFENFTKCYNETKNSNTNNLDSNEGNLSPTRLQDFWFLYNFVTFSFFYANSEQLKIPSSCDRQELVALMDENYENMNSCFVNFWSLHKRRHSCGSNCSRAFVCDGFQKPSRFICSNVKKSSYNEELGLVQVGCGNRPDYDVKRKKDETDNDESILLPTNSKDMNIRTALCRACKSNPTPEYIEEEFITNSECNIDRNPRFVNGKVRSYGVIYTMYNCGIVVDFLEINLSEQVYVTLLHWMNMLRKIKDLSAIPRIFIYDNACSVWIYFKKRLHENKTIVPTELALFLDSCDLYIDRLHQKTHTRPMCLKDRNINTRPDLADVNTVICEQTNSWLKQYLNMLCNFSGERSKFYYLFLFHLLNCKRSSFYPEKHFNMKTF